MNNIVRIVVYSIIATSFFFVILTEGHDSGDITKKRGSNNAHADENAWKREETVGINHSVSGTDTGFLGAIYSLISRVNSFTQQVLDDKLWFVKGKDAYIQATYLNCKGTSTEKFKTGVSKLGKGFAEYSKDVDEVPPRVRSGLEDNIRRIKVLRILQVKLQDKEPFESSVEAYTELDNLASKTENAASQFNLRILTLSEQSKGVELPKAGSYTWQAPSDQRNAVLLPSLKKLQLFSEKALLTGMAVLYDFNNTELLKLFIRRVIPAMKKNIFLNWSVSGLLTARRMGFERHLLAGILADWLMFDYGLMLAAGGFEIKGKFTCMENPYGITPEIEESDLDVTFDWDF